MKKLIFLILTLAIPVAIFLFLKAFGRNTFEVPYYFDKGIPDCSNNAAPHRVPRLQLTGQNEELFNTELINNYTVYGVLEGSLENQETLMVELIRIQDAFYETGSPYFILFAKGNQNRHLKMETLVQKMGLESQHFQVAYLGEEDLHNFLRCGIGLIDDTSKDYLNLVLVDLKRRVRGVYASNDVEQTDQLILELKILKQNNL